MPQNLILLGGDESSPTLHMAPANGFPPQVYAPLLHPMSARFRCLCFPPRPLWDAAPQPPDDFSDWQETASDLLTAIRSAGLRDVLLVGHSLGALVSLMAAVQAPELFRGLVMLDPVILPLEILALIEQAAAAKALHLMPHIQGALRRRRYFDSRESAFARFRSRASFADWSDEAIWLYVTHGLKQRQDKPGLELAWSVDWEVWYFATVESSIWRHLQEIDGKLPLLIVRGQESDTFTADMQAEVSQVAPSARMVALEGQGHLFPQAAPQVSAQLILSWLDEIDALPPAIDS